MEDYCLTKDSIIGDIEILSQVIRRYFSDFFSDNGSFEKAKNQCGYEFDENEWGYHDCNMFFNIDPKLGASKPLNIGDLRAEISISLKGEVSNLGKIQDPLNSYVSELKFTGISLDNDKMDVVMNSWHLDRNIPSLVPKCIHPLYHLQFGGNTMSESTLEFGNAIILDAPRIQHPPLDIPLFVDFVFQNFYDKNEDNISQVLNSSEYRQVIENSHYRLWRPYYIATASKWITKDLDLTWPGEEVLPWINL